MKSFLLGVLFYAPVFLFAQAGGYSTLYLNVTDSADHPVAFTDVWLIDATTSAEQEGITDHKGKVHFRVDHGSTYYILFDKSKKHSEVAVPSYGSLVITRALVYQPPASRATPLAMDTLDQSVGANARAGRSEALFVLKLKGQNKAPIANYPVVLTSTTYRRVYRTTTDRSGNARFLIKPNSKYLIGLEDWADYSSFNFPDYPGGKLTKTLTFEPTNVEEQMRNDTVRQTIGTDDGPTSARFLVTVQVRNYENAPLAGEELIFDVDSSQRVYLVTTDEQGIGRALLPKQYVYDVHLKYESYLARYDFRDKRGFGRVEIQCRYRGSEAIENYMAQVPRDENGIPLSFQPGMVETKVPENLIKVKETKNGFDINLSNANGVSTPGVVEDRLFISHGIYSNLFHCLNAHTGEHYWTVALSEGGASAVACENGVVLVNTESCTLYALDVQSGRMLWSHWLSPYLWTTPSVYDGLVYTVYANDASSYGFGKGDIKGFVMACFDLKNGAVKWQKNIANEGMGAPVIAGNLVYMATRGGELHRFNRLDGSSATMANLKLTAPPTVVGNRVFAMQQHPSKANQEQVVVLEASILKVLQTYPELSGKSHFEQLLASYHVYCMHHQGSQALHYKGFNYQVLGENLVCSDPRNGKLMWKLPLPQVAGSKKALATMPSLAGDELVLTTLAGEVWRVHPINGKILDRYATASKLWSQAVVANGNIYTGSNGKNLHCIQTGNPALDGWGQWSMNGTHNPVVMGLPDN